MTINEFDYKISDYIKAWPAWVHPAMLTATFIGYPAVIGVLAGASAIIAWLRGRQRIAGALIASFASLGLNTVLKHYLHRSRPDTLYVTGMKFKSYSFPSGHAFGAAAFYGLVAYLAFKYLPAPWNLVTATLLVLVIILIGLSRVYLGAHFPTDVIGGWVLGSAVLAAIIIFIKP